MSLWTDPWHTKSGTVARELISSNRSPGSAIVRRNFLFHSPRLRGGGGGGGGGGGRRRRGKDEFTSNGAVCGCLKLCDCTPDSVERKKFP